MSRKLKIRDLTLRDGQQSLFATRLTQEQDKPRFTLLQGCRFLCDGSLGWCCARFGDALFERESVDSS